eukprot:11811082-Alexandrium_andersonii.AAC.1
MAKIPRPRAPTDTHPGRGGARTVATCVGSPVGSATPASSAVHAIEGECNCRARADKRHV